MDWQCCWANWKFIYRDSGIGMQAKWSDAQMRSDNSTTRSHETNNDVDDYDDSMDTS